MKRKILGFAAIAVAIAASAFTVPTSKATTKLTSYKWFEISGSVGLSSAVPQASATYLGEGTTAPEEDCSNSNSHQCVSGFNANQVNTSNQLINNSQMAQVIDQTKD
ncbi:hypothetical protein [Mucilaginibacter sp. OK098]|uniref:hypothetical protein n=1 Tax=Mucilaginibacter sp. OK098 TaxID=1855297 RepID=UPI00090F8671|nr:hypothetical protein [Mucilaginibacter sp. OK098]SHM93294.1 hypothetical protein SAMN05216524_104166 [Mucilaginibacter sp. OK098]